MGNILNSLRFQLFIVVTLLATLVGVALYQNVQSVSSLISTQASLEIAGVQRSNAYLLSSLARRLLNTQAESERASLNQAIQSTLATVANNEAILRIGDEANNIIGISDESVLPLLDTVDEKWIDYTLLIESFLLADEAERSTLINEIDSQSIITFTFTDRIVRALTELTFQQNQRLQQIAIGIGVILIVAVAFSIFVVLRMARSIGELGTVAQAYSEGNRELRANTQTFNEVSAVGRVFNAMASELNTIIDNLENMVATRTSELRIARDEAQASARIANENSRLKSEFLSMMSHELRTPMNAIEGYTGIILQRMAGVEFNDKTERFVTKVQSNSRRLLGLINDFLDLSRIESGRLELAHQPMSPSNMAQQWHDNLSILADEKALVFEVTVDPNLPQTIYGDEESLSKVAINLLGNAIKFTEEGTVSLSLDRRDEQMIIEVTDTGMGIPPHAREFVFEEFRQVDQTSTRRHGGTGLGLAITQKLVRAMGGTITLDSEVGIGSTFTVVLPIHIEQELQGVSA